MKKGPTKSGGQIQTILFDLDGTLIDTEKAAALAIRDTFASWNVAVQEKDANYITGRTWGAAFDFLFEKYAFPVSRETALNEVMAAYRRALEQNLPVVPGSIQAVRSLAEEFELALVSGSHRKEILWALKKMGIDHHFSLVLGAEDYPRSKPAPDPYNKAVHALKAEPRSSLVFEDSQAGIASARAAGLWVVGITGTNHFAQDTSQAHHLIPDLTGVSPAWIGNLEKKLLHA